VKPSPAPSSQSIGQRDCTWAEATLSQDAAVDLGKLPPSADVTYLRMIAHRWQVIDEMLRESSCTALSRRAAPSVTVPADYVRSGRITAVGRRWAMDDVTVAIQAQEQHLLEVLREGSRAPDLWPRESIRTAEVWDRTWVENYARLLTLLGTNPGPVAAAPPPGSPTPTSHPASTVKPSPAPSSQSIAQRDCTWAKVTLSQDASDDLGKLPPGTDIAYLRMIAHRWQVIDEMLRESSCTALGREVAPPATVPAGYVLSGRITAVGRRWAMDDVTVAIEAQEQHLLEVEREGSSAPDLWPGAGTRTAEGWDRTWVENYARLLTLLGTNPGPIAAAPPG
jgi:hypothetical protein